MSKGDIKIKKREANKGEVTFDPRLSQDKKTFVLVVESYSRMSWYEALQATYIYSKDEIDRILGDDGSEPREH